MYVSNRLTDLTGDLLDAICSNVKRLSIITARSRSYDLRSIVRVLTVEITSICVRNVMKSASALLLRKCCQLIAVMIRDSTNFEQKKMHIF